MFCYCCGHRHDLLETCWHLNNNTSLPNHESRPQDVRSIVDFCWKNRDMWQDENDRERGIKMMINTIKKTKENETLCDFCVKKIREEIENLCNTENNL